MVIRENFDRIYDIDVVIVTEENKEGVISDVSSAKLVYSYSFDREGVGHSFRTDMHHKQEHMDITTYLKGEPGATLERLRLDPEGEELKLIGKKKNLTYSFFFYSFFKTHLLSPLASLSDGGGIPVNVSFSI
jgi:hypothetical protein